MAYQQIAIGRDLISEINKWIVTIEYKKQYDQVMKDLISRVIAPAETDIFSMIKVSSPNSFEGLSQQFVQPSLYFRVDSSHPR